MYLLPSTRVHAYLDAPHTSRVPPPLARPSRAVQVLGPALARAGLGDVKIVVWEPAQPATGG